MYQKIITKKHRLNHSIYKGYNTYFLTLCLKDKNCYFNRKEIVDIVKGILINYATSAKFDIYAYCFMPDHLHLLISASDNNCDLNSFVKKFKQISGFKIKEKFKINFGKRVIMTIY